MDTLKDFYKFYRPLQRGYDLRMFYKTNGKEAKITIRWRGKELVKVTEETKTNEKAQRAGFYVDKIRKSYAEKQ